jgi:hypothetical protein
LAIFFLSGVGVLLGSRKRDDSFFFKRGDGRDQDLGGGMLTGFPIRGFDSRSIDV